MGCARDVPLDGCGLTSRAFDVQPKAGAAPKAAISRRKASRRTGSLPSTWNAGAGRSCRRSSRPMRTRSILSRFKSGADSGLPFPSCYPATAGIEPRQLADSKCR